MRAAMLGVLLVSLACAHAGQSAPAPRASLTVIDATPAFWKFWDAAQNKPEGERVRLFFEVVVAAHPELFTADVLEEAALSGQSRKEDATARVAAYLHDVTPYIPRMRELSKSIARDLRIYADDFTGTFPDYAPATPVYFTVSMFSFDGATRRVTDRTALLFGIDGMARYGAPGANPKVLFDHELFHQYHEQVAPELTAQGVPLWISLWKEGLATYVSQRMNPGSSESDVLMFPRNLSELAQPKLPSLARELLANFDSRDPHEYAAFFYGRNGRPDVPPRAGYYVGYRIARKLAEAGSPQQIALLRGVELKAAVRLALEQFAREP